MIPSLPLRWEDFSKLKRRNNMEKSIKNLVRKDILDFLSLVQDLAEGYDVYLGGGYLRDRYYNEFYVDKGILDHLLIPKDLDIFFVPKEGAQTKTIPVIPKTYINFDIHGDDVKDVRPNVKRVMGIFNKNLSVCDVQFIEYKTPMTGHELARDMDMNINQIMLRSDGQAFMTKDFVLSHENKVLEFKHEFTFDRMASRLNRMQNKFPAYKFKGSEILELASKESTSEIKRSSGSSTGSFIED